MEWPVGTDTHRFRMKVRHFPKEHEDHIAIQKLSRSEPLTAQDLAEMEHVFVDAGIAVPGDLDRIRSEGDLGVSIRSLADLDRETAKRGFDQFRSARTLSANRIKFVNMIIDHLTERGVMNPRLLYESPFTDFDAVGIEGVFDSAGIVEIVGILEDVRNRAAA